MKKSVSYQAEGPVTVREVLKKQWKLTDRQISRIKFLTDGLTVNGRRVNTAYVLQNKEVLTVSLENADSGSAHLIPQDGFLRICYEDADLVVVNKPSGLVTHPSHGHYQDTLANLVYGHYARQGCSMKVRPVGRLDRDTSGLILFAKHGVACEKLCRQKQEGMMVREYLALAEGIFERKQGELCAPLGPEPGSLMRQQVRVDGKPARTSYQVVEEYPQGYSRIQVRLYTGRTHQIRAHMAYLGHPLLGDALYGNRNAFGRNRVMLHSWRMTFLQPFSGEQIQVETEEGMEEDGMPEANTVPAGRREHMTGGT